jgi:pheromone alpha factor receptor
MASATNSTFDPLTQPVTIYMADGVTPVMLPLDQLQALINYSLLATITYGCQIGACFVMFVVILVLSKPSKRRTAMFILNALSLLLGFLRSLFITLYYVSPWTLVYTELTLDFTYVPRPAYSISVVGSVLSFLMTLTVDMSLVLQAYTVCKNMRDIYRLPITGLACLFLLAAVGFAFAEMVTNCMAILSAESYTSKDWIQRGYLITQPASIWFFSVIFTGKLVYTLITRKIMGWKQWSGVRILAALGGCTMIIPCKSE